MTIASALTALNTDIQNARTAITNKGGTVTSGGGSSQLATDIATIPSGGTIDSLTVTPTTSQQTITASGGVDGYSPITVNAVTASIDNNIVAGNIKSGVSILGVSGSVTELQGETRSVSITSTSGNTFTPSLGKNGITSITVTPTNQARTVTPTTSQQSITVNSGYSGNGTVTVGAVTSAIDNNITAGNIKKNVTILGITGTYEGSGVTPTGTVSITTNGTYDITTFASASVNVSGGNNISIPREVSSGVYRPVRSTNYTFSLPSEVTQLDNYSLFYAFYHSYGLQSVDLSSLTYIGDRGMSYTFATCSYLTSAIDLSSVTEIGHYGMEGAFQSSKITSVDLSSLTKVGNAGLKDAFLGCTSLTSVDLSSFTSSTFVDVLKSTFNSCTALTDVNLSNLRTIDKLEGTFYGCTSLTSIDLSSLQSIAKTYAMVQCFYGCTSLTSIDLSGMTTIGETTATGGSTGSYGEFGSAFYNCTNLTSISFPELTRIYCTGSASAKYGTFYNNNKVQKFYFPKLNTITYGSGASSSKRNAYKYIFSDCSSLTEIHFGAANQSAIEATAGYSTLWGRGAGNATVYFDL